MLCLSECGVIHPEDSGRENRLAAFAFRPETRYPDIVSLLPRPFGRGSFFVPVGCPPASSAGGSSKSGRGELFLGASFSFSENRAFFPARPQNPCIAREFVLY